MSSGVPRYRCTPEQRKSRDYVRGEDTPTIDVLTFDRLMADLGFIRADSRNYTILWRHPEIDRGKPFGFLTPNWSDRLWFFHQELRTARKEPQEDATASVISDPEADALIDAAKAADSERDTSQYAALEALKAVHDHVAARPGTLDAKLRERGLRRGNKSGQPRDDFDAVAKLVIGADNTRSSYRSQAVNVLRQHDRVARDEPFSQWLRISPRGAFAHAAALKREADGPPPKKRPKRLIDLSGLSEYDLCEAAVIVLRTCEVRLIVDPSDVDVPDAKRSYIIDDVHVSEDGLDQAVVELSSRELNLDEQEKADKLTRIAGGLRGRGKSSASRNPGRTLNDKIVQMLRPEATDNERLTALDKLIKEAGDWSKVRITVGA